MTFFELYRLVETYLHLEGESSRHLIKLFLNESIVDFLRVYDWRYSIVYEDIEIPDDTKTFSLYDLDNFFFGEIRLLKSSNEVKKMDYWTFLKNNSPSNYYTIMGTELLSGSTGNMKFIFKSSGFKYKIFDIVSFSNNSVIISGDKRDYLRDKNTIIIRGTENNNGIYNYSQINYVPFNTEIILNSTIPDISETTGNVYLKKRFYLEFDDDTSILLEPYFDILSKYAVSKFFYVMGIEEEYRKETELLNSKILLAKAEENRIKKNGIEKIIKR